VVKFVMLDNSPAGIMIVRFPVELEHRRAKVPLQDHSFSLPKDRSQVAIDTAIVSIICKEIRKTLERRLHQHIHNYECQEIFRTR